MKSLLEKRLLSEVRGIRQELAQLNETLRELARQVGAEHESGS